MAKRKSLDPRFRLSYEHDNTKNRGKRRRPGDWWGKHYNRIERHSTKMYIRNGKILDEYEPPEST